MTATRGLYRTGIAFVVLAGMLLALGAPTWAQGPPLTGSGAGQITSVVETSSRDAGGNRIAERLIEGTLTGTLAGTFVEEVRGVVHPNGQVTFHGTLIFTGEIEGCGEGTITGRLQGRGQANPPLTDAKMQLVDQSSHTVQVTGRGTVHQDGPLLSYEIQYICR